MIDYDPATQLLYATQHGDKQSQEINQWVRALDPHMRSQLYGDLFGLYDSFREHIDDVKGKTDYVHKYMNS